jgi:dethiobiotin synthetase
MGRAVFVSGTGTDAGKTFACSGILRATRRAGLRASYFKPVLTGGFPGDEKSDPDVTVRIAGLPGKPENYAQYWFREPASPHFSARLEKRAIDPEALVAEAKRRTETDDYLLIEGCGGLAVPLSDEGFLVSDFAARLDLPLILIVGTRLGTIHDTLVTIEHARSKGIFVSGIVWNGFERTPREHDTIRTVERLGDVRTLLVIPQVAGEWEIDFAFPFFEAQIFWNTALRERDR